jgi:hypothetical protein
MMRICVVVLVLASTSLHAGDVYVWVDETGRRQISDVVPPKYRAKAKRVEVPDAAAPPADARSAAAGGSAAPVAPRALVATDCTLAWQLYIESRECMAFKEEALRGFDVDPRVGCPVAAAPPAQCPSPETGISSK